MPQIKNLYNWLETKLRKNENKKCVTFKANYIRHYPREWGYSKKIEVCADSRMEKFEVTCIWNRYLHTYRTLKTLNEVVQFIQSEFPPNEFVYYYPKKVKTERW